MVLIFNLSFNATNNWFELRIVNNLLPVFFSDREPFKLLPHSVVEKSFFVKSHIVDSNDTSLSQPEHVFWLTAYLKTYLYRTMENEKDLFDFLHTFIKYVFWRYFPGLELG